jgi:hypothetical protein
MPDRRTVSTPALRAIAAELSKIKTPGRGDEWNPVTALARSEMEFGPELRLDKDEWRQRLEVGVAQHREDAERRSSSDQTDKLSDLNGNGKAQLQIRPWTLTRRSAKCGIG